MRALGWSGRLLAAAMVIAAAGATGCKTLSERYIALEVWKYEKCFGHLPPGFTPAGAAAAPPRVCGQGGPCETQAAGCDPCQGQGGTMIEAGVPAGATVPAGPGGAPGPAAGSPLPAPAGFNAGKPIVISDEIVTP